MINHLERKSSFLELDNFKKLIFKQSDIILDFQLNTSHIDHMEYNFYKF